MRMFLKNCVYAMKMMKTHENSEWIMYAMIKHFRNYERM